MTLTEVHRLAVAANLAYVPWDPVNASTPRALAAQALGFEQLSPRWVEAFFTDPAQLAWRLPAAGIQPNEASGFAANLIDTAEGRILAIRGTEFRADRWQAFAAALPGLDVDEQTWRDAFGADLDILVPGLAVQQAVSLANLLRRLQAPLGTEVTQIALQLPSATDLLSLTAGGVARFLSSLWQQPVTTFTASGLGVLSPHESLRVVGHSLGGHLAALALRLFPDLITDATVFNAPGFDPLRFAGFTDEVVAAISTVLGLKPAPDFAGLGARLHNVVVESAANDLDVSLVPSRLTGAGVYPPPTLLRTEVNSHSMDQIADNLAALSLLETMMPEASTATLNAVFDASSALAARSVEALLEGLSRHFLDGRPFATAVAGLAAYPEDSFTARAAQLDALWQLRALVDADPALRLESLLDQSPTALAALALGDASTRYALRALEPYRVLGGTGDRSAGLDPTAFDEALVSLDELGDRARLFHWAMQRRLHDDTAAITAGSDALQFEDRRNDLRFAVLRTTRDSPVLAGLAPRIVFGGDDPAGEHMAGGQADDRLYGGGGPDELVGGAGSDHLEGGSGDDLLLGDAGADRLLGGPGHDVLQGTAPDAPDDGVADWLEGGAGEDELWAGPGDEVQDHDGRLHVLVGTQWITVSGVALRPLAGDAEVSLYETTDDTPLLLAYHPASQSLRVGAVTVHDFVPGDLGLVLPVSPSAPPLPVLAGTGEADRLRGSDAAEQVLALAGDDRVRAAAGDDRVAGGDGDDVLSGDAGRDLLLGEVGRDVLLGGEGDDRLDGGDGADALSGDAGRDLLQGGAGADLLAGGAGEDLLLGGSGDDLLLGGVAFGEPLADWRVQRGLAPLGHVLRDPRNAELLGFPGLDPELLNRPGDPAGDLLYGEAGADFLIGSAGPDLIDGGPGDDSALGGDGDDVLVGGPGNDHLRGSGGSDRLAGGEGDDFLVGQGTGDDGESADGDDRLAGGAGSDELQGGPGDDDLSGDEGDDQLFGGPGDDVLDGGADQDQLFGDAGNDRLSGGEGDDRLRGGECDDQLLGNAGDDRLNGEAGADRLEGDAGDDHLAGGDGDDVLAGGAGRDQLNGGSGADWLDGGPGDDRLAGGSGNDVYVFGAGAGRDTVIDAEGSNGLWLRDLRSPSALVAEVAGDALVLHGDAGSELRIEAWRQGAIDWLRLGDTLMLDGAHLLDPSRVGLVVGLGRDGDVGTSGDDELRLNLPGGTVSGGAGNDRYVLPEAGTFILDDPDAGNTLVMPAGAAPGQLQLAGIDGRWQLTLGDLHVDMPQERLARVVFDSGFVLDADELHARFQRELPMPPRIVERIGNQGLLAGHRFEFPLPDAAFVDPNPQDSLVLEARLADGGALPRWLQFDASAGRFVGTAPAGVALSLNIEITATDPAGLSASQRFGLDVQPPLQPGAAAMFVAASIDGQDGRWITRDSPPFAMPDTRVVAALGDLDGDGLDDLLVGNRVVFGQRTRPGVEIDALAARGFTLAQAPAWLDTGREQATFAVHRIDVNGDGREDVLLDPDADAVDPAPRVLLARHGPWPAAVDYGQLPSAAEFTWDQPDPWRGLPTLSSGEDTVALASVMPLGDFDGDGRADFGISALIGERQHPWRGIVFGATDPAATLDLAGAFEGRALALQLPPYDGYPHFNPGGADAASGWGPLSALGDVNGDGLADLGVGSAPYRYTDGYAFGAVVLGRRAPSAALDLNALDGVKGFLVAFPDPGTGHALAHVLAAAGDVNGDGNDDILGLDSATGASFIVHGRPAFLSALTVGSEHDDVLEASDGTVLAGAGDDLLQIRAAGVVTVDPGTGRNTVRIEAGAGAAVYLRGGAGENDYHLDTLAPVDIHLRGGTRDRLFLPPGVATPLLCLDHGQPRLDIGTAGPRLYLDDLVPAALPAPSDAMPLILRADGTAVDLAALWAQGAALSGSSGADELRGSSLRDRITAGEGDDFLDGGAGDDLLDGGRGNDRYLFPAGSGLDVLADADGDDVLVFPDLAQASALVVRHEGEDLVLAQDAATELRIRGWHSSREARIEGLQLGDQPPLALETLVNRQPQSARPLPTLHGYLGHALSVTLPADAVVDPDPLDVLDWRLADNSGALPPGLTWDPARHALNGQPASPGSHALSLVVSDPLGATLTRELRLLVDDDAAPLIGTAGDDGLEATPLADQLIGRAGNDRLWGLAGDDVLSGGPGADLLWGGEGDDRLRGGPGDDVLDGGPGDDAYLFEPGAGCDLINEGDASGHDEILLRGVTAEAIALWREEGTLALGLRGTGDVLRVAHWFEQGAARVDAIRLGEGSLLAAERVDALLEAMARFDPGHDLGSPLPASTLLALEPVLAAAWH